MQAVIDDEAVRSVVARAVDVTRSRSLGSSSTTRASRCWSPPCNGSDGPANDIQMQAWSKGER
jgi:hypothetical protein